MPGQLSARRRGQWLYGPRLAPRDMRLAEQHTDTQMTKILFAPAHYMLDSIAGGSEFSWADNIIRSLAAHEGVEIVAITGIVKAAVPYPSNVRIIALDRGTRLNLT